MRSILISLNNHVYTVFLLSSNGTVTSIDIPDDFDQRDRMLNIISEWLEEGTYL